MPLRSKGRFESGSYCVRGQSINNESRCNSESPNIAVRVFAAHVWRKVETPRDYRLQIIGMAPTELDVHRTYIGNENEWKTEQEEASFSKHNLCTKATVISHKRQRVVNVISILICTT